MEKCGLAVAKLINWTPVLICEASQQAFKACISKHIVLTRMGTAAQCDVFYFTAGGGDEEAPCSSVGRGVGVQSPPFYKKNGAGG